MENEITLQAQANELSNLGVFSSIANFKELYDIGKMFATSKLVPDAYQNKPMDCTIAVDMANRMGTSPMMVMQNLYVVKGKPSWSGQACMAMIRANKEFKNVRPIYTGERQGDSWGCYVQAENRKTGEIIRGTEVTITMAKAEKWYQKDGSKWQTIPEQMLAYRAAAFFARVYIPNSLMGMYVEGEVDDISKPEREETTDPFAPDEETLKETEEIFG